MKYIFLDHNEAETGPECCLAFAVSNDKYFKNIEEFYRHTCTGDIFDEFWSNGHELIKTKPNNVLYFSSMAGALEREFGVCVSNENTSFVFVVEDDADIRDMCIQYKGKYYRYAWCTTG